MTAKYIQKPIFGFLLRLKFFLANSKRKRLDKTDIVTNQGDKPARKAFPRDKNLKKLSKAPVKAKREIHSHEVSSCPDDSLKPLPIIAIMMREDPQTKLI